jgi:hypothetical protein
MKRLPRLKLGLPLPLLKWHPMYKCCANPCCGTSDPTLPKHRFEAVIPGIGPVCKSCYCKHKFRTKPHLWDTMKARRRAKREHRD